jgi:hypothetical protein
MVSLINSHTNAIRIGWHLREIGSRFAPGLPSDKLNPEQKEFREDYPLFKKEAARCVASLSLSLHPTPCTLHPTLYTLHSTPCTLHPAPYPHT